MSITDNPSYDGRKLWGLAVVSKVGGRPETLGWEMGIEPTRNREQKI
jgi:hypothetical protein